MSKLLKRFFLSVFFLVSILQAVESQIFSEGKPIYSPDNTEIFIPKIEIDVVYEQLSGSKSSTLFKDNQFAQPINVDINPDDYGVWIDYPKLNKKVWLLEIDTKDASSINLILSPFNLEEGVKLFFYNKDKSQVKGAITSHNNKLSDILPVSIIEGSSVYCELQIPLYQKKYGDFTISLIGAGYPENVPIMKSPTDKYFGTSDTCHLNVNCVSFKNLDYQKKSVCRIIYQGSKRCTGTLINNIDNDETPYVITAAHCIRDEFTANGAVFYFNYESPDCSDTDVEPVSISGATLIAAGYRDPFKHDTLDFALLKLSESPPIYYDIFFSGWDATNNFVDSTYSIHHPQGDLKKIAIDLDSPETGDFTNFDDYTHWLVRDYEFGTTEVGSSGAGLFDQNSRLIGTLTGGGQDPCDPFLNDLYQKFHHSYNDYNDSNIQLKHWLDPNNTGDLVCYGYDPSFGYRSSAGLLFNYNIDSIPYVVNQTNGSGYIAGHNFQENYLFAERYSINGSKYLVGANFNFAKISTNNINQYVNFIIWKGGETPGEKIYEQKVLVSDFEEMFLQNPDVSQAVQFDSTILVDYDFYFGYQIGYNGDTFALKTYPAGEIDNSAFTNYNNTWQPLLLDGKSVYSHLAMEIYAFDVNVEKGVGPDTSLWPDINIYPNPASEKIQIYFNQEISGSVICTLYNISGQPVLREEWFNPGSNMPLYLDVPNGVYILQVVSNNSIVGKAKVLVF